MSDWNVVVTIGAGQYAKALNLLSRFGQVERSDYYNVLTLQARDISELMDGLLRVYEQDQQFLELIGKVVPAGQTFSFSDPQEFMSQARRVMPLLAPQVAGLSFHVRMHRRGFKGLLSTMEIEQMLDGLLLELTSQLGNPATLTFSDPQVVVVLETVGRRAGVSLWSKEQRYKYPFLRLD